MDYESESITNRSRGPKNTLKENLEIRWIED